MDIGAMSRYIPIAIGMSRSQKFVKVQGLNCAQMSALTAVAFFDIRGFSIGCSEGWCPGAATITNLSFLQEKKQKL
jgi:hypothetical protein